MIWVCVLGCDFYMYGLNCKLYCGYCFNEEFCDLNIG